MYGCNIHEALPLTTHSCFDCEGNCLRRFRRFPSAHTLCARYGRPTFCCKHEQRLVRLRSALTFPFLVTPRFSCDALMFFCVNGVLATLPATPTNTTTPPPKGSGAQDELAERIDWVMQESTLEEMHPWASAAFSHSSYFSNIDLMMFLINRLNEAQEEEEGTKETKIMKGV